MLRARTLIAWTILIVLQCFCNGCDVQLQQGGSSHHKLILSSGVILSQGRVTNCYYRAVDGTAVLQWPWKTPKAYILHAMLWPSLIFIVGFVSLFFSCLSVQIASSEKRHRPSKNRRNSNDIECLPFTANHCPDTDDMWLNPNLL